jgi:hypothetical protein
MYASFALNRMQILPATPVMISVLALRYASRVSSVLAKKAECFGFSTK